MPVFFRATDCVEGVPTVTSPKLTVEVLGESCGADATPVPDKVTDIAARLLSMEISPEAAPAAAGLKDAVKSALWPAPKTKGVGIPEAAKPFPEITTALIVKSTLPVFDKVTG